MDETKINAVIKNIKTNASRYKVYIITLIFSLLLIIIPTVIFFLIISYTTWILDF